MSDHDDSERDSVPPSMEEEVAAEYELYDEDRLRAALERSRVVGVLDAWEDSDPRVRRVETWVSGISPSVFGISLVVPGVSRKDFAGSSRDAARAAAAKAIEAGEV